MKRLVYKYNFYYLILFNFLPESILGKKVFQKLQWVINREYSRLFSVVMFTADEVVPITLMHRSAFVYFSHFCTSPSVFLSELGLLKQTNIKFLRNV